MNKYADLKRSISLKDYAENKLKRKDKTFVCPNCGSGEGPNGTPAFFLKGESWRCFSCDRSGDIFDLAGIVEGIGEDDKRGQLEAVAAWAGYPLEGAKPAQIARPKAKPEAKPEPKRDETLERIEEDATKDFWDYWGCGYASCKECPALIDGKTPKDHYHTDSCEYAKVLDLLRRQRLVLERGQE